MREQGNTILFSCYIKLLDVLSQVSWARRSEASTRSHISDRVSLISSVPAALDDDARLTPQQYGVLGKFSTICYCYVQICMASLYRKRRFEI